MKIIDWMFDCFKCFPNEPTPFLLAVHSLDLYISKRATYKKLLDEEEFQLSALTSILIASKTNDIFAVSIDTLVENIGFYNFSEKGIFSEEY